METPEERRTNNEGVPEKEGPRQRPQEGGCGVRGSGKEGKRGPRGGAGGASVRVHTYNFWAWLMRLYSTLIWWGDGRETLAEPEGHAGPLPPTPHNPAHPSQPRPPAPPPSPTRPAPAQRWISPRISAASASPSGQTSPTPAGGSNPTVPGPSPWQGRRAVMEGSQAMRRAQKG